MTRFDAATKTWFGPTVPSIFNPEVNFGSAIFQLLSQTPSKIIQINADSGQEMSCAELCLRSIRVALHLRPHLIRVGICASLVCTLSDNVMPVIIGCLTLGFSICPLAPGLNEHDKADMDFMFNLLTPIVVFCDEDNRKAVERAVAKQGTRMRQTKIYVFGRTAGRSRSVEELLRPADGEESFKPPNVGNPSKSLAVILAPADDYGLPKAVVLSHAQVLAQQVFASNFDAGPIFNICPIHWPTGLFAMLTSLYHVRPHVITQKPFAKKIFVSIIKRYKVEDIFTPQAHRTDLQNHRMFSNADFICMDWYTEGLSVSKELHIRLKATDPKAFVKSAYGLTEIGLLTSLTGPHAPESVGTLGDNVIVKIVNRFGQRLGIDERGEIRVMNKHRLIGYMHYNKELTRPNYDAEMFFKTGHIGYFDENGFLYVLGRADEIIKYRNFYIQPAELEAIIARIDGVQEVCCVGAPMEDRLSDLPVAAIVRTPGSTLTAKQVTDAVVSQVSDHMQLRGGVLFLNFLPKSSKGKVLRTMVKYPIWVDRLYRYHCRALNFLES